MVVVTLLLAKYLPLPARFFGPTRATFVEGIKYATTSTLRLPRSSLDGFYASHVLEHVAQDECRRFLSRIRGWLKPGGVLRVVLPELRLMAEQYPRRLRRKSVH